MTRIERRNKKLCKKAEQAQSVYLIVCYAKWCVREYKWTGKWTTDSIYPYPIPEVYHFTDHNGYMEEWYKRPITATTTGFMLDWTFNKTTADKIVFALNKENEQGEVI